VGACACIDILLLLRYELGIAQAVLYTFWNFVPQNDKVFFYKTLTGVGLFGGHAL